MEDCRLIVVALTGTLSNVVVVSGGQHLTATMVARWVSGFRAVMSAFPKNDRFQRLHTAGQGVMCLCPTESTALSLFGITYVLVVVIETISQK